MMWYVWNSANKWDIRKVIYSSTTSATKKCCQYYIAALWHAILLSELNSHDIYYYAFYKNKIPTAFKKKNLIIYDLNNIHISAICFSQFFQQCNDSFCWGKKELLTA